MTDYDLKGFGNLPMGLKRCSTGQLELRLEVPFGSRTIREELARQADIRAGFELIEGMRKSLADSDKYHYVSKDVHINEPYDSPGTHLNFDISLRRTPGSTEEQRVHEAIEHITATRAEVIQQSNVLTEVARRKAYDPPLNGR